MKKTLLTLLLALCMLVSFATFTAFAEETEAVPEGTAETATHTDHCVCGGNAAGVGDHTSCETVLEYTPISEALAKISLTTQTVDFGKLPSGNYYLDEDIKVTADSTGGTGKTVNICLNGNNITTASGERTMNCIKFSDYSFCDCQGEMVDGQWVGGSVSGGTSTYGAITYTRAGSKLNIYGGKWTNGGHSTNPRYGGLIVVAMDGSTDVNGSGGLDSADYIDSNRAYLNLYNGELTEGVASRGGNVFIMHGSCMNMYGGVVSNGQTVYSVNGTSMYPARGGNLYSDAGGTFNMYGGDIFGGVATQHSVANISNNGQGGNICSLGKVNIYGGNIFNGYAEHNTTAKSSNTAWDYSSPGRGGNIYMTGSSAKLNISDGNIYGGKANGQGGGNIWFQTGTFTMSGGKIWGGIANADGDEAGSAAVPTGKASEISGGSIHIYSGTFTMTGGSIGIDADGNAAGGTCYGAGTGGGNLYVRDIATVDLQGGTIANGVSNGKGGNIWLSGTATVSGSMVIRDGKAATSNGGNIYMYKMADTENPPSLTVSGSAQITGGLSYYAGGNIYADTALTVEGNAVISGGTVTNSSSGNIYVKGDATVTIKDNAQVKDGTSTTEGGNIANYGTLIIQDNAIISGGTATSANGMGGNIHSAANKTLTITGGTITGGTATKQGGNICFAGSAEVSGVTISNGTVNGLTDGKPVGIGGNIYIASNITVTLTNCTITGGTANQQGGSIFSRATLKINGGSVTNGSAIHDLPDTKVTTSGGNIYCIGSLEMDGTTVSGGTATHGGNIAVTSGTNTIKNATISDGNANQMCDGTTNGNGGNIYSTSGATTTITDCTITGGVGRRGGSIGAWGKVTIENTTITGGEAIYNGGNIMTYGSGQLTLKAGTVLSGGTAGDNGGAISFNSTAGKKHLIEDGVTIVSGTCEASPGIYISGGDLTITGAPEFDIISFKGESDDYTWNIDQMTTSGPIQVTTTQPCYFATSATDKLDLFVNNQGYIKAYRDGKLYLDAPTAVYVSDNGSDSNPGTQTAPYLTVDHALDMLANNGTVNILDKVTMASWDRHEKAATLTGGELDLTTSERLELGDSIHFKAMTITMPTDAYYIYCDGFKTVIDEDVIVRYFDGTDYTAFSSKSYIYGGGRSTYAKEHGAFTGTDLTVLSGVWGFIYGGNNQDVDMTGDVHLTVGGNVNKGVNYATAGHSSSTDGYNLVYGGSRSADITGTVYMTITGNAIANSFHGGSNGATHVDNIELTVSGGEGMALYGAGRGGAQTVGTVNVYYQGGTIEQVFGGALSKTLTGDVNMYITGGNITRRLYGGCYSDYSTSNGWTADNFVTGNIKLVIGEDANIPCNLKDPSAGLEALLTGGYYTDRGIYGHSRRAAPSTEDAENATIIFLSKAAYDENSGKLGAVDSTMNGIMGSKPVADLICYLDWTADDTADMIYANATAVADPKTGVTGDASAVSATAALTLSDDFFYYTGSAIEPATVTVSDNWIYGDVALAYANNVEPGTGKATITANGYTVGADFTIQVKENVAQVIVGGQTTTYQWLQDAVNAAGEGSYLKLIAGVTEDVTVSKDLYLDLAGYSITGNVTVEKDATLYGMDSTTDDYDCTDGNGKDNYGTIKVAGEGAVASAYKTSVTGKVRRYLTCTESEGVYSFHRIYLGITHMSLRPSAKGVGYKATFRADAKAQELLNADDAFGYTLWIEDSAENVIGTATRGLAKEKFTNEGTVALRLQNFDVVTYGEHNVYATVYLKLTNGDVITSSEYVYTLRSMIEKIDGNVDGFSVAQMEALQDMLSDCAETLTAAGWAISNIMSWSAPAAQ